MASPQPRRALVVSSLVKETQAPQFLRPWGVAVDASGTVYVADSGNHRIRKVTPAGSITTVAGSGEKGFADGTGGASRFDTPTALVVDADGTLYVADAGNHRIRKVTPAGVVTTLAGSGTPDFADGSGSTAQFHTPTALALDASGTLYVADTGTHRIRKVTPAGVVTTLAGSGKAGFAEPPASKDLMVGPSGVAVAASGDVYVADPGTNRIFKVTPAGVVSPLAGGKEGYTDGTGAAASFNRPMGVALDAAGNLYVADRYNHRIRLVSPGGVVTTLAGGGDVTSADAPASRAQFAEPIGLCVDASGTLYVADQNNDTIRLIR